MLRTKTKSFRMTELQLEQLKEYLEKEQTEFSDFLHSLIQREIMQNATTVVQKKEEKEEEAKPRVKVKRIFEVIKRYQKTDPDLLLELSKIGNNLNQIARALNIIKNASVDEQKKLDILSIFLVLKDIQTGLEQIFPTLPEIKRQTPERLQKQLSSIALSEEDERAY